MNFLAPSQSKLRQEVERAAQSIRETGAEFVEVSTLLPADVMLDIYGEDIRNRAFLVHDGAEGDFVLRPDFTVPLVEAHLASGQTQARYAYAGRVWRKKRERHTERKHSFWQIGVEFFDANQRAQNDAEVFSLAREIAEPWGLSVRTGDLGLVFSLLDQIEMPSWRRDALKRQFWRPRAFEKLLERYSSPTPKYADLDETLPAPAIGLRTEAMIQARIERLKEDAKTPPISKADGALLRTVLGLQGSLDTAAKTLSKLAQDAPVLQAVSAQFDDRLEALKARDVPIGEVAFDASFGRESMEYYDGFVFGFYAGDASVITGGRYDQLARSFGADRAISAVGLAYRPELLLGDAS